METFGEYDADDIKSKMQNLKAAYGRERKKHTKTGAAPSKWPFYQQMHIIIPDSTYKLDNPIDSVSTSLALVKSQKLSQAKVNIDDDDETISIENDDFIQAFTVEPGEISDISHDHAYGLTQGLTLSPPITTEDRVYEDYTENTFAGIADVDTEDDPKTDDCNKKKLNKTDSTVFRAEILKELKD